MPPLPIGGFGGFLRLAAVAIGGATVAAAAAVPAAMNVRLSTPPIGAIIPGRVGMRATLPITARMWKGPTVALAAALGLALAGCGEDVAGGSRPLATERCKPGDPAPRPELTARRSGYDVTVEYRFAAGSCLPARMNLIVWVDKVHDHRGVPKDSASGEVAFPGPRGRVEFSTPLLELPPYLANAFVYAVLGSDHYVHVSERVPESEPYCRESRPLDDCLREAEDLAAACRVGSRPQSDCHPRIYRTDPEAPAAAFNGHAAGLESSLAGALRAGVVNCPNERWCYVVFVSESARFRLRYGIQPQGRPGCWRVAVFSIVNDRANRGGWLDIPGRLKPPAVEKLEGCIR